MTDWIKVEDELPPITERFTDIDYHAQVDGFFPQFRRDKIRRTVLWTAEGIKPRWMVNMGRGLAHVRPGPTHWTPLRTGPQDHTARK